MIRVGIDVGIETTKVVVMHGGDIIGRAKLSSGGWDRPEQAEKALALALEAAGVEKSRVSCIIATGKGKYDVSFANRRITEAVAAVSAAKFLVPGASAVLSVGADECIAATMGKKRPVGEFVLNQKCSAGLGTLISTMANRLEMPLERLSALDISNAPDINQGCAVFAELDALSLLAGGASAEETAGACIKAAAVRAATVARDITVQQTEKTALIGGMAKNCAFAAQLEKNLGYALFIPEDAEFAGAIGAVVNEIERSA